MIPCIYKTARLPIPYKKISPMFKMAQNSVNGNLPKSPGSKLSVFRDLTRPGGDYPVIIHKKCMRTTDYCWKTKSTRLGVKKKKWSTILLWTNNTPLNPLSRGDF